MHGPSIFYVFTDEWQQRHGPAPAVEVKDLLVKHLTVLPDALCFSLPYIHTCDETRFLKKKKKKKEEDETRLVTLAWSLAVGQQANRPTAACLFFSSLFYSRKVP
jgi:hypothetical protein